MRLVRRVALWALLVGAAWVVADPLALDTVLRAETFALAAAIVAAVLAAVTRRYPPARGGPFDPPAPPGRPEGRPLAVAALAVDLAPVVATDRGRLGRRHRRGHPLRNAQVPLQRRLRRLAADRLADRHGVDLADPTQAGRVAQLLGPDVAAYLTGSPDAALADAGTVRHVVERLEAL